ncbi:hypothetical protein HPB48_026823 [Haemaphysalis longicornis]|uniref:CCHC-type domain-containing protein n=1 Tax=Haemaphysalis longicornis TaxID=44386 RepID=A0A9J6HAG2_HAELO|nr:hypothetical protein HPB48_026823 [Haemaphysalis longicornis]
MKRNKTAATHGAPPAAQPTSQHSAPETAQQKRSRMPPLPVDDTKIIYRPQAGLQLSKWSLAEITNAIGRASKIMQKEFYDNVRIQVQRIENLVIASTPRKDLAFDFLGEISSIQLGRDIFTVRAHVKTPEWISRGVISGVPPNTSPGELMDGLRVPERYTVVAARMLGKSSAAVIYFNGPHVPFNVTYQSGDYRCRPYRKTVQHCRSCGELGHRQDICPHPGQNFCHKCGQTNQLPHDHECRPYCKICKQPHEAGTDCRQKLKPGPPPPQASLDFDHGEGRDQYECDKAGRQEESDDVAAAAQQDRAGNPNGCGRPTAAAATARVSLACGGRKGIYVGGEMAGAGATCSCRCTDTLLHRPCQEKPRTPPTTCVRHPFGAWCRPNGASRNTIPRGRLAAHGPPRVQRWQRGRHGSGLDVRAVQARSLFGLFGVNFIQIGWRSEPKCSGFVLHCLTSELLEVHRRGPPDGQRHHVSTFIPVSELLWRCAIPGHGSRFSDGGKSENTRVFEISAQVKELRRRWSELIRSPPPRCASSPALRWRVKPHNQSINQSYS